MESASKHYTFVGKYKGRKDARFEVDGKVFVTDRDTLDLLNHKRDKGSLRVAQWLFAVNLATGRIKRTKSENITKAD
jgi:hypothetical protein